MHSFILFIYSFSTLSPSPNFIFSLSTFSAPITAFLPSNCCCLLRRRAASGSLMLLFFHYFNLVFRVVIQSDLTDQVDDMDGFQFIYLFIYLFFFFFFFGVDFRDVTDVGGSLVWVSWTRQSNANLWCSVARVMVGLSVWCCGGCGFFCCCYSCWCKNIDYFIMMECKIKYRI